MAFNTANPKEQKYVIYPLSGVYFHVKLIPSRTNPNWPLLMENLVKVKTHLKSGEKTSVPPGQYTEYARSVLDGLVGSLQTEVSNLRVWSLVRMKGDGFSDWMIVSQRPKA